MGFSQFELDTVEDLQRLGTLGGGLLGTATTWVLDDGTPDVADQGFSIDWNGANPEDVVFPDAVADLCTSTALTAYHISEALAALTVAENAEFRCIYDDVSGTYCFVGPTDVLATGLVIGAPAGASTDISTNAKLKVETAGGSGVVVARESRATMETYPTVATAATAAGQVLAAGAADRTQVAVVGVTATAVSAGAGNGAKISLAEETGGGVHKVSVSAPDALVGDCEVVLPPVATDMVNYPQMAAVGAIGEIVGTPAADREQAKTLLNYIAPAAGSVRKCVPEMFEVDVTADAALYKDIYTADAPYAMRIIDACFYPSAAVVGATVQLRNAVTGGGAAMTDTIPAAVIDDKGFSAERIGATATIAAGTGMSVLKSDILVAGTFYFTAIRTA